MSAPRAQFNSMDPIKPSLVSPQYTYGHETGIGPLHPATAGVVYSNAQHCVIYKQRENTTGRAVE